MRAGHPRAEGAEPPALPQAASGQAAAILNTESFRKGQDAARAGRPETDNPFSQGSSQRSDWQLGWRLAVKLAADNENRRMAVSSAGASPYDMGRAAGRTGLSPARNPFHAGHPAHDEWRLGWANGKAA
jgi:ribosome modulation factor